jgi:drug/metabolite transporter (DMT)-like permease
MTGALWATAAGLGFGLFQSLNRRAVQEMDVILVTFLQLFVSSLVLSAVTLLTIDLSILEAAPPRALVNFALAGLVHFFAGWTFMNASQKRVGAARTSPLIGTTPLFGAALAAITLGEFPTLISWVAIFLMMLGIYMISDRSQGADIRRESGIFAFFLRTGLRDSFFGLATAVCWATSPIFIRLGLDEIPSPLFGVTVGMLTCVFAYAVPLLIRRNRIIKSVKIRGDVLTVLVAGLILGLATWARWIGLELTKVATVLSLSLLSIPVVMVLSPILYGRQMERITIPLVVGALLIMGGSLLLIYSG